MNLFLNSIVTFYIFSKAQNSIKNVYITNIMSQNTVHIFVFVLIPLKLQP